MKHKNFHSHAFPVANIQRSRQGRFSHAGGIGGSEIKGKEFDNQNKMSDRVDKYEEWEKVKNEKDDIETYKMSTEPNRNLRQENLKANEFNRERGLANHQTRFSKESKSPDGASYSTPKSHNVFPVVHKAPGNKPSNTIKIEEKCIICETPTEKCCSLCRKVFYCCPEHQGVDWHMKHKFECEGRMSASDAKTNPNAYVTNSTNSDNKFLIYGSSDPKNTQMQSQNSEIEKEMEHHTIQAFLCLLEQRLVLRAKIMNQVAKLNERTPSIVRESLVKQAEELIELTSRITKQEYKPSFSHRITKKDIMNYSSEQWGSELVISDTVIGLEYISDLVLMAKIYHLASLFKECRELIISVGKLLEDPDQKALFLENCESDSNPSKKLSFNNASANMFGNGANSGMYNSINIMSANGGSKITEQNLNQEDSLAKTKNLVLQAVIQLSEIYNIDKTSESAFKLFIKKVEMEEGIWEQIYAYFNMGVWYMKKTYYDKSGKAFLYCLELLDSHKKNVAESVIFRADCLFNIAQSYWLMGDKEQAIENMQECYRVRVNGIGKNSMESSYCLFILALWYRETKKWSECLQYLEECHRVRKLYENQPGFEHESDEVKELIKEIYETIKSEKKKNMDKMDPRAEKYFEYLLSKEKNEESRIETKRIEESQLLQKDSVSSRLFKDDKEYVKFKVVISQELWDTVSSEQAKYLSELIELTDEKVEKSEAIRMLIENEFVSSLTNGQRETFFKENQINKSIIT